LAADAPAKRSAPASAASIASCTASSACASERSWSLANSSSCGRRCTSACSTSWFMFGRHHSPGGLCRPGRITVLKQPSRFPMSAWLLPDHIADVLPSEARHIEELRRELLDAARGYGYELVMPPLLEYLASLLSDASPALNLQT